MDSKSKMFRESHPDTVHSRYSHEVNEEHIERGEKLQQALSAYPFREEIVDKGSVRSDRNILNEALKINLMLLFLKLFRTRSDTLSHMTSSCLKSIQTNIL